MNAQYLVVGMATPALHVFDTATCTWLKSLEGHRAGVWAINIITPHVHRSASGIFNDDGTNHGRSEKKQSVNGRGPKFRNFAQMKSGDPMGEVRGWGSRRTLVVSGGGDRDLRVWKLETGYVWH
jgi:F-box and WD-40 domain protein CDC4